MRSMHVRVELDQRRCVRGIVLGFVDVRHRVRVVRAAVLAVQQEFGSLAEYLWQFVGGKPIQNAWTAGAQVPAETAESRAMSKTLVKRGFRFVGPTICYAFMQATGMVNDHITSWFRYRELR